VLSHILKTEIGQPRVLGKVGVGQVPKIITKKNDLLRTTSHFRSLTLPRVWEVYVLNIMTLCIETFVLGNIHYIRSLN